METREKKETIWQKHPMLTVLGAMVANLCLIFSCICVGELVERRFPSVSPMDDAAYVGYALAFVVFLVALYLTGWCAETRLMRIIFVLSASTLLMIFWFIILLIIGLIGMGLMARLYLG
jgi:hypothetical protein